MTGVVVKKTLFSSPILLAALLLLVAMYFQAKSLFGFGKSKKDTFDEMDVKKDTISPYAAKALADKLYTSMSSMGTDEQAIYNTLGILSKDDFSVVYNQFGKRRYDRLFGNDGVPLLNDQLDLIEWIYQELNDKELAHLRDLNPALSIYFKV